MRYFTLQETAILLTIVTGDWITPSDVLHRTWVGFNDHLEMIGPEQDAGIQATVHRGRLTYREDVLADLPATRAVEVLRYGKTARVHENVAQGDPSVQWWRYWNELEEDERDLYFDERDRWQDEVARALDVMRDGELKGPAIITRMRAIINDDDTLADVWGIAA